MPFKLFVSADDLIVLINSQQDIDVLTKIINEFVFISSAKVKLGKQQGFDVGGGLGRVLTLCWGLQWKTG